MAETTSISFARPGTRAWVSVDAAAVAARVVVNGHEVGSHVGPWTSFSFEISEWLDEDNRLEVVCEPRSHPTMGFLPTVGIEWCGASNVRVLSSPPKESPAAVQRSRVDGTQLLVDGEPFRVRGVLHWGYYPELGHPWPDEATMRGEIETLLAMGFNLIKFCLWIPPRRYYELCDELGMSVWQEYPLWTEPLDDFGLVPEYEEFLRHDRSHSCVILRTLTCENDHVDPDVAAAIIERARELIPGVVILDNSGWICAEGNGDFHDEHIYLHNGQWPFYRERMVGKLTKPLLLGEAMAVDSSASDDHRTALAVRRQQIATFTRDFPDAGYVVTALRDLENVPLGLFDARGGAKYEVADWAWHGGDDTPREIPGLAGPVIGPRKGEWKCAESTWWSPVVGVLDEALPRELIVREAAFELLSGRVLTHCQGTRVLVELVDVHSGTPIHHPLVIEFESEGERHVVSAFREDTPAGREVRRALDARVGPAPDIGALVGDAIVLEDWELARDGATAVRVKCDTPLVNAGRNVFEGWATFRARFSCPGGRWTLRCESVGDFFEVSIDGDIIGEAGNRTGTWDGTRDVPREFELDLAAGDHDIVFEVRDWRGAGGMVGPVYLTQDLDLRIF